jgi:hypothetical protein
MSLYLFCIARWPNWFQFFVNQLLLENHKIFWKDEVAQRNDNIFGLLFAESNLLLFHLNWWFQNTVCCWYFKVSKVVWCRCFGLLNAALMKILAWFCLGTVWATIWRKRLFFKCFGHPGTCLCFLEQRLVCLEQKVMLNVGLHNGDYGSKLVYFEGQKNIFYG